MRRYILVASTLTLGLAGSAYAQSNMDAGPTNSGSVSPSYSSDYTSGDNGTHPIVVSPGVDSTTTQSIVTEPKTLDCPGMPQQRTGVDTRGGESGASISDACREYDN